MDFHIKKAIQKIFKIILFPSYILIKFIFDSILAMKGLFKIAWFEEADIVEVEEKRKLQITLFILFLFMIKEVIFFYFPTAFKSLDLWEALGYSIQKIAENGEAEPVTAKMYGEQVVSNGKAIIGFIKGWFSKTLILSIFFVLFNYFHFKVAVEEEEQALDDGGRLTQKEREKLRKKAMKEGKFYLGSIIKVGEEDKEDLEEILVRKAQPIYKEHLFLSPEELSLHAQVVGGTGTGKTASIITPLSLQQFRAGYGGVIIDAKGDAEFYENLKAYLKKYDIDRPVKHINLAKTDISDTYNPLLTGEIQEIQGRLMQSYEWSDEFYKQAASNNLLTILQAMDIANLPLTYKTIYRYMSSYKMIAGEKDKEGNRRNGLIQKIPRDNEDYHDTLLDLEEITENWEGHLKNTNGLRNNLKLTSNAIGAIGNTTQSDINIGEAYANNEIVYVTLPTNMYEEHARAIGRILLLDLKATANAIDLDKIKCKKRPFFIHIDEASEFVSEPLVGFLNKARSSKMSVSIYHQSIADMEKLGQEIAKQIGDNSTLKIIFRVNKHSTAEEMADDIGTYKAQKDSKNIMRSNEGEKRKGKRKEEEDKHRIDPNILLNSNHKFGLKTGQAVITSPYPDFFCYILNTDFLPQLVNKSGEELNDEKSNNNYFKKTIDILSSMYKLISKYIDLKGAFKDIIENIGQWGAEKIENWLDYEEQEDKGVKDNQKETEKTEENNKEDKTVKKDKKTDEKKKSKKTQSNNDNSQTDKSNINLSTQRYKEILDMAMKQEINSFLVEDEINKKIKNTIKNK